MARRLCSGPICGAAEHLSGPFGEAREIRQGIHPLFAGCYQAEDIKPRYSAFWGFWDLLKNYIFSAFERAPEFEQQMDEDRAISFGIGNVLTEYLLAGPEWREGITTWHSLREDCAVFYKTAVNRTGAHPAILYSVGRVLNSIGSQVFFEDGVEWLSDIISNNPQLRQTALPTNTIYYMEEYMYRYVQKRLYLFKSDALRKHKGFKCLGLSCKQRVSSRIFATRRHYIASFQLGSC